MGYCAADDLLIGDVPTVGRADLNPTKYINDATDEIDSKIGFRYATPVDVTANGPTPRPVLLLLKRICSHLASGRLLMAADASGQRSEVHAYGARLVREASEALKQIVDGTIVLDIPPAVDPTPSTHQQGPLIFNVDPVSQVESFYDTFASRSPFAGS